MLRLTPVSQTCEEVVLKVEGWVVGADVVLLEEEVDRRLSETRRLVLDLQEVRFIDRTGIDLLRRWVGDRLVLREGSLFIRALLRSHRLV